VIELPTSLRIDEALRRFLEPAAAPDLVRNHPELSEPLARLSREFPARPDRFPPSIARRARSVGVKG
jgi:hypothetical protein